MRTLLKQLRDRAVGAIYADDYDRLIRFNAIPRPNYAYILWIAADLAKRLGIPAISALEFGVAGGNGLVAMQAHADRIAAITGISIRVFGFDTGVGLPPPKDYRDLPYVWQESQFRMDEAALRKRLGKAELILGDVRQTLAGFAETHQPPPVGAISFDLDYYSSTVAAFGVFGIPAAFRLPRILCYFDDILSTNLGHVGPAVGVPLAIEEYRRAHPRHALDPLTHLEFAYPPARRWHRQIYSFGDFDHPRFNDFIYGVDRQLPLA
ncbi:hypothetical protein [Thermaurantiacus tibetensis]|uniref:hypothetical protein n=1 Tax=Thermaurantiacus tibetensis TaxID=2759035 RepID=UPI00188FEEB8|nr:hypothetical protein [Thermaurantiacus tibetensis]